VSRRKVAILISGRGSNMSALIDACRCEDFPAEIVRVISNRPGAPGLDLARRAGIATATVDHTTFESRDAFDAALDQALREAGAELVCNAGFMRLLGEAFVAGWRDRQLNIHPSLLPSYRGLHTHERVLHDGVRITGCTVHFVRTEMDAGPIVAQAAVPVCGDDTPDTLGARVLDAEHRLYPEALRLVASGAARVVGEKVIIPAGKRVPPSLYSPGAEAAGPGAGPEQAGHS